VSDTVVSQFDIRVEQRAGYEFDVHFDKEHYAPARFDEPPPLGKDTAPNAARYLAAAIGNCLAASLTFCLKRQGGVELEGLTSHVHVEIVRNAERRLRVGAVRVRLAPKLPPSHPALEKCLPVFEEFCTVTQSIRAGIHVDVSVEPQG
jgi:uncharacterized OsmC-like protein